MPGLFNLTIWKGAQRLDDRKIFAKSIRGALSIAGKMVEQHPLKQDIDFASVRSLEDVDLIRRRYYDNGFPISLWVKEEVNLDAVQDKI